jgi:methyl-accepting chemotaxis protein
MKLFASVKARIYAAFISVVSIILIIAATAILMTFSAEAMFGQYRQAARQSLEINDYVRDVETLRMDFSDYLHEPTGARADRHPPVPSRNGADPRRGACHNHCP